MGHDGSKFSPHNVKSHPFACANRPIGVVYRCRSDGGERIALCRSPLKDVPAPSPLAAEKAHLDKLDAALAPLLSIAPSAEDAEHLRDAVSAVRSNNMDSFAGAKAQISDPIARKLADWIRLRNGMGDAAEYKAFLRDNPLWPARSLLTERLEAALFTEGDSAKSIKSYFAASPPETGMVTPRSPPPISPTAIPKKQGSSPQKFGAR